MKIQAKDMSFIVGRKQGYLTHEPGEDDFVDIEDGFNMVKEAVINIYRENGAL